MSSDRFARTVSVERRAPIAVLRFANPPVGCITTHGAADLHEALVKLLADPDIRAIVLTGGQDGIFIRHADVAQLAKAAEMLVAGRTTPAAFTASPFARLCNLLDSAAKPVIAAIDGACMGGGLEIALACTMRIASPAAAAIGLPEIRIGIFPGSGGTQRLPRVMGRHQARLFILRGSIVAAEEAYTCGIVDEVAPNALQRAIELANDFARRSAAAVSAILHLTQWPGDEPGISKEFTMFAELLRDDPAALPRLRHFVDNAERLDEVD